jgi:hypothetical protein
VPRRPKRRFAQVARLKGTRALTRIRGLASSPRPGRYPIRTHVRRPIGPSLLYFAAVLAVRFVRIMLLTSGAKEIRTPDLLHAIWRQHVHPRPSPQVTVLPRPCTATRVPLCCCTSVLYRCHPRRGAGRGPRLSPDQPQPCTPGYRCALRRASGQTDPEAGPRHSPRPLPHSQPRTGARRADNTSRAHQGPHSNVRFCLSAHQVELDSSSPVGATLAGWGQARSPMAA